MWSEVTNVELDTWEFCLSSTFYLILGRICHISALLFCGAHGISKDRCGNLICGEHNACVQMLDVLASIASAYLPVAFPPYSHATEAHAFLPWLFSCKDAHSSSFSGAQVWEWGSIPLGQGAWC